uniref:Uncharacterized protein n=1 Tax=Aegilops tauschii subsp. strangulata TaxID=200361 RepID=A0A453IW06_AEGTS
AEKPKPPPEKTHRRRAGASPPQREPPPLFLLLSLSLPGRRLHERGRGRAGRARARRGERMESMEPMDIDWNRVVSRFVLDETYEGIEAPHWADL